MRNTPYDLRDYLFGELSPEQAGEVERHLAESAEAREELGRLRQTWQALESLPAEEPPRRIAFVSDKVFDPSPVARFWRGLVGDAPRLAFGLAAVLAVVFAGLWAAQPSVRWDSQGFELAFGARQASALPAAVQSAGLSEEQVRAVMLEALEEAEKRQQEALANLVDRKTAQTRNELQAEMQGLRTDADEGFTLLRSQLEHIYAGFALASSEPGR